jgi:hypothetical protein
MVNVHGYETYLVLQLFYTLLQLASRLSSICEVKVGVADLRAKMRVFVAQAGLNMFAIDEEVLSDGPESAERVTGMRLQAQGRSSFDMIMSRVGTECLVPWKGTGHQTCQLMRLPRPDLGSAAGNAAYLD